MTETIGLTASLSSQRVFDPDVYGQGDPTTFGMPLDFYDRLREQEPCFLLHLDHPMLLNEVWVVSRYEDVAAIDRDAETWAANRGFVNIWAFTPVNPPEFGGKPAMIVADGDDHRRQRGLIRRAFTLNSIAALEERFRSYAVAAVESALAKGTCDFIEEIAYEMPMQALGDMLGVPEDERKQFFGWVDVFASPFDPRVAASMEDVLGAVQAMWAYSVELVERKAKNPGNDVMSTIAQAYADEALSPDEIMGNVSLLASGAAESTRSALGHGMHELMRNPQQMAWLRNHTDDVPLTAVHEMVRIATPFTHLVRTATRDVELHGQHIKEGDRVAMLFAAANFDPKAIAHPRRFDLSRDPNPHFGFGRGPHACLGKHVAVFEIKILLEELLRRTSDIRPAGEISYVNDSYARGVYSLPVTLTPA